MRAQAVNNFLLPNGTFLIEFVIFAVVLTVLWRFVLPPLQKAMVERQELIRREIDEGEAARRRLAEAEAEYREALAETRADATRIREESRLRGQQALTELKVKAAQEYDRMSADNASALEAERAAILSSLRPEIGALAADLAGRILGEPVAPSGAAGRPAGDGERDGRSQPAPAERRSQ